MAEALQSRTHKGPKPADHAAGSRQDMSDSDEETTELQIRQIATIVRGEGAWCGGFTWGSTG